MRWRRHGEQPARGSQPAQDARDGGGPLAPEVRSRMQSRLGHDFSSVRIHHRPEEAKALRARAFTVGEDVTFAPGQYAPGTPAGDRLLEHELGHVVDHRHGAPLGAYRAPEGEEIPTGPERPLTLPRRTQPFTPGPGLLSLHIGTLDGFAFNGAELTEEHRKRIAAIADQLVTSMASSPGGRIAVTGHTDLVGGEAVNLDLGRKRAIAVAAALTGAGVPAQWIDVLSAGESAPVVETQAREPRNRRVEIRFSAAPIGGDDGGPRLRLGPPEPPPLLDFRPKPPLGIGPLIPGLGTGTPAPTFGTPGKTPFQPAPGAQQPGQLDPGSPEPQTKAGSAGDVAKAVAATPQGKKIIEDAKARAAKDAGNLKPGDKVVLGIVGGSVAAGIVAGLASDPAARKSVLDLVDGTEIPLHSIPGLGAVPPGIAVVPHTKDGGIGGGLTFDIVQLAGGGKKK